MSKRHKPVSKAQIGLLSEVRYWENVRNRENPGMEHLAAWYRLRYLGEEMIMKALIKKGLVVRRYDDQIDSYYIAMLPKGRRYLRFINSLYYCASCGAVNWTPTEPCKCGNIAVRKGGY